MNWIGFVACIAAWVWFAHVGDSDHGLAAFVSAVICSFSDGGSIVKVGTKSR